MLKLKILFLLIIVLYSIAATIGTSIIIYKFFKYKNLFKPLRIFALIPVILISYIIYDAFYPPNSFYKEDFKEVTGVNFPDNGKIIYKTSSFPDYHGDYTSISVTEIDSSFYNKLSIVIVEKGFIQNKKETNSSIQKNILKKVNNLKVLKQYRYEDEGVYYNIGFLSNNKSLIVKRLSW